MGFPAVILFPTLIREAKVFLLKRIGDTLGIVEELSTTQDLGLTLIFVAGSIVLEAFVLWREAPEGEVPEDLGEGLFLAYTGAEDDLFGKAGFPEIALAAGGVKVAGRFVAVFVKVDFRADEDGVAVRVAGGHPAEAVEGLFEGIEVGGGVFGVDGDEVRDEGVEFAAVKEVVEGHGRGYLRFAML